MVHPVGQKSLLKGWYSDNRGFLRGSVVKNPPASAGDGEDLGWIPESGRSPASGNPLQYSCLENFMDRGTRWATVLGITRSGTWLKWLSTHIPMCMNGGGSRVPLQSIFLTQGSNLGLLSLLRWQASFFFFFVCLFTTRATWEIHALLITLHKSNVAS